MGTSKGYIAPSTPNWASAKRGISGFIKQKEQIQCFDYICASASNNQVLSVHSKKAEETVLTILKKNKVKKAILHWYSGDLQTLNELLDCGYYFSVNSNMLNSQHGQTIIRSIPLEKILVESDGPFTKVNSNKYNPSKLQDVYAQLEQVLNNSIINEIIWDNFSTLLK